MKKLSHVIRLMLVAAAASLPVILFAADTFDNPVGLNANGVAIDTVPKFLIALVQGALVLLTPLIVVFFVYAGFLFVTAQGNEAKLEKAKRTVFWSVIGALLIVGAIVLSAAICHTIVQLGSTTNSCII